MEGGIGAVGYGTEGDKQTHEGAGDCQGGEGDLEGRQSTAGGVCREVALAHDHHDELQDAPKHQGDQLKNIKDPECPVTGLWVWLLAGHERVTREQGVGHQHVLEEG